MASSLGLGCRFDTRASCGIRVAYGRNLGGDQPQLSGRLADPSLYGDLPAYATFPADALLGIWQRWDAVHHLSLALAADLQRRQSTARTLLLILVLALSLWVHFVTGYYIAAIVVATLIGMIGRRRASLAQSAVPAVRTGTLALVMVASLVVLFLLASIPSTSDFLRYLTGIVTIAFPVLLGALQPSASHTLFASQLAEKSVMHALGVGLGVIVCLAVL